MKHLIILAIFVMYSTAAPAAVLTYPSAKVFIETPAGWSVQGAGGQQALVYEMSQGTPAKIHFMPLVNGSGTLEEIMKDEIAREKLKEASWKAGKKPNDFLGTYPVKTKSGMDGIAADFGYTNADAFRNANGVNHNIVKFYFRKSDGQVFKVCAHIYGGNAVLKYYEDVILNGLSYAK